LGLALRFGEPERGVVVRPAAPPLGFFPHPRSSWHRVILIK
jgi:hypothetical protein